MKLVAWNANYNNQKRTHEQVTEVWEKLQPDIAVISETVPPAEDSGDCVSDLTDGLGVTVVARNGFRLTRVEVKPGLPPHFFPVLVSGPVSFLLVAVWPKSTPTATYYRVLIEGLDAYADLIRSMPTILAGDFNSNTKVSGQHLTHSDFVKRPADLRLESAYHHQGGHEHGKEPESTYFRTESSVEVGWHIDYCFASRELLEKATINLGERFEWIAKSDHLPLVLDVPNANFTKN